MLQARPLPALRDAMKRMAEEAHHMTNAEIEKRLESLTDTLTEIIVDQALEDLLADGANR